MLYVECNDAFGDLTSLESSDCSRVALISLIDVFALVFVTKFTEAALAGSCSSVETVSACFCMYTLKRCLFIALIATRIAHFLPLHR